MTPEDRRSSIEHARQIAERALRGSSAPARRHGSSASPHSRPSTAPGPPPAAPARVTRAFSHLLDDLVSVPGTRMKFGIDPLLSFIPGAGSTIGGAFGAVVLIDAIRLRAPVPVIARMVGNYILDWLIGLVPVLGGFFDMAYRSNRRNLVLLNRTLVDREVVRRASVGWWLGVLGMVALVLAIVIAVPVLLFAWLESVLNRP